MKTKRERGIYTEKDRKRDVSTKDIEEQRDFY